MQLDKFTIQPPPFGTFNECFPQGVLMRWGFPVGDPFPSMRAGADEIRKAISQFRLLPDWEGELRRQLYGLHLQPTNKEAINTSLLLRRLCDDPKYKATIAALLDQRFLSKPVARSLVHWREFADVQFRLIRRGVKVAKAG